MIPRKRTVCTTSCRKVITYDGHTNGIANLAYACATPPRNAATALPSSVNVGIDCINRVSSRTSRTCPVGFSNFNPPPCRSSVTKERTSVLIPELSICDTATRFTITSDGPASANLRNSALSVSLLVPIIIRPTRSITITLPDFRVEICRPMFASQAALATLLLNTVHRAEGPPVVERQRQAAALFPTRAAKWPHYNPFATRESKFCAMSRVQKTTCRDQAIFVARGPTFSPMHSPLNLY